MIEAITGKFTEITSKCLEKQAKENDAIKKQMQLVFKLGIDGEVEYLIYKDFKPLKSMTFLQVLGVKIDLKGYSFFVPKFIKGALNRFSTEENIDKSNVRVVLNFNEYDDFFMWLYDNSTFKREVTLESLFDGSDMLSQ